jgi:hypothetical protein
VCADDGGRWVNQAVCSGNAGDHCVDGRCGDPCEVTDTTRPYLGCEYWATQTPNSQLDPGFVFSVVLGNPHGFNVHVNVDGGVLRDPIGLDLTPGEVRTVTLPWVVPLVQLTPSNPGCAIGERCSGYPPARSATVPNGAFRVRSDAPVAAYQFNPLTYARKSTRGRVYSYSNDASLLIARRALTQRYLALTMSHWAPQPGIVLGAFIAITAVTGETTSATVRLPENHGVAEAVNNVVQFDNLMPGTVAVVMGSRSGDLSGATIEASNPVAVFVGHDCAQAPHGREACDHLEEQAFPLEALGRDYLISGLRDREQHSLLRVVSPFDTVLSFDPPSVSSPIALRASEVFQLSETRSFRLFSTRPALVAQFMVGQGGEFSRDTSGDPAMSYQVPVQQFRDRYDFLVPETYVSNFLGLAVPRGATVLLDGAPIAPSALVTSNETVGPWNLVHTHVAPGRHTLRTSEGGPLGVKVYGIAPYTSYMYPGGLDLRLLPPG